MILVIMFFLTAMAGFLQSITGFGGGIVIMVFLPQMLSMNLAPAVSGTCCTPLAWSIALKYWKHCNYKKIIWPVIFYISASTLAIKASTMLNMNALKPVFGIFLILLAIYFSFFSNTVKVKGTMLTAFICSVASGILGGFFGIGGPFLVLYFLAVTDSKEEYLGTINGVFALTTVSQFITRIITGIITVNEIPIIAAGIVGILLGSQLGGRVVSKLDGNKMKKMIYAFLGVAGMITVVSSL